MEGGAIPWEMEKWVSPHVIGDLGLLGTVSKLAVESGILTQACQVDSPTIFFSFSFLSFLRILSAPAPWISIVTSILLMGR